MRLELDGSKIGNESDFHKWWAKEFDIQGFYGENLDALRDSLLGGIERPVEIIWVNSVISRKILGSVFDKIIEIFIDAQEIDTKYKSDERFTFCLS